MFEREIPSNVKVCLIEVNECNYFLDPPQLNPLTTMPLKNESSMKNTRFGRRTRLSSMTW